MLSSARTWGGYNFRVTGRTVNTLIETSALAYQCLTYTTHTHMQSTATVIHVVKLRYVYSKHSGSCKSLISHHLPDHAEVSEGGRLICNTWLCNFLNISIFGVKNARPIMKLLFRHVTHIHMHLHTCSCTHLNMSNK